MADIKKLKKMDENIEVYDIITHWRSLSKEQQTAISLAAFKQPIPEITWIENPPKSMCIKY